MSENQSIKRINLVNPVTINTQEMHGTPEMMAPIVKRRNRRTQKQEGGTTATATPIINVTKVDTPMNSSVQKTVSGGGADTATATASAPTANAQQQKSNIPPGPELSATGGSAALSQGGLATKVVLKSKNRTAKVLLKKKTLGGNATVDSGSGSKVQSGGAKKSRKVVLKSISKRVKKTRHAVKHAKDLPLEKLKKILIEKKLIKATSKAPESILRQIYADSLIVGKKML